MTIKHKEYGEDGRPHHETANCEQWQRPWVGNAIESESPKPPSSDDHTAKHVVHTANQEEVGDGNYPGFSVIPFDVVF